MADDDELTEAEQAEVAEFVRKAEARRLGSHPGQRADSSGDEDVRPPVTGVPGIAETFGGDGTPLIRTDFSDDRAWAAVVAEVTAPRDFEGSPYGPYEPHVAVFEDRAFEGATGETLANAWAADEGLRGYVVLGDARSMADAAGGDAITVAYVDLSIDLEEDDPELQVDDSFPGRTFRCAVSEFASIEANLAIANLSFGEFADEVGPDGVFRGFESGT